MAAYTNFYETVTEANMRLRGTVILYDQIPHYVIAISNHRQDGIFRIYMEPLGVGQMKMAHRNYPMPALQLPSDVPDVGVHMDSFMDTFLDKYKKPCPVIRKQMNSPLFNKFRPFPLGMCNSAGKVVYFERSPQRRTEQGLNLGALTSQQVFIGRTESLNKFDYYAEDFVRCIKGDYPSAQEALTQMRLPSCENEGVAFHRLFAFIRGPANTMFLANKADIVGFLPENNLAKLFLAAKFHYLKESITDLGLFENIVIR